MTFGNSVSAAGVSVGRLTRVRECTYEVRSSCAQTCSVVAGASGLAGSSLGESAGMPNSTIEQLRKLVDEAGGEGPHMCALCFRRLASPDAKTQHMELAHGYETLKVVPSGLVGAIFREDL